MNYLAHSYFVFSEEQIVGQFLEDVIPNRDRFSFPEGMQQGITLHREKKKKSDGFRLDC